jgi:hypothetical protein
LLDDGLAVRIDWYKPNLDRILADSVFAAAPVGRGEPEAITPSRSRNAPKPTKKPPNRLAGWLFDSCYQNRLGRGLQISDHVRALLAVLDASKCHDGARHFLLWVFQIGIKLLFSPSDARTLIGF